MSIVFRCGIRISLINHDFHRRRLRKIKRSIAVFGYTSLSTERMRVDWIDWFRSDKMCKTFQKLWFWKVATLREASRKNENEEGLSYTKWMCIG